MGYKTMLKAAGEYPCASVAGSQNLRRAQKQDLAGQDDAGGMAEGGWWRSRAREAGELGSRGKVESDTMEAEGGRDVAHRCTRTRSLPVECCAVERCAAWCHPSSRCGKRRRASIPGAPRRSTLDPLHRGCLSALQSWSRKQAHVSHHTSRHAGGAKSAKRSVGQAILCR
jgi:hypothetical protein